MCEGFFGLFSDLRDPSRAADHYGHFVDDGNWMLADVTALPTHGSRSLKVLCNVTEIGDDSACSFRRCSGKILLFLSPADTLPTIGDRLLLYAQPRIPSAADNPHQFDYRKHLRRRGILYTSHVPSHGYRIVGHSNGGLLGRIASLRQAVVDIIQSSSLSPDERGIAEALFLGWDDDLAPETEVSFRTAGITHLLCVSGLHVGIVALLVGYCLFFLGNSRRHRIIKGCIQIVVICFFVLLTGMAPGTVRAGLMFSLIVIGQMLFSRPPTLNAIAASAVILLAINPLSLFEIGFQLSYCSVIAIVVLVPQLSSDTHPIRQKTCHQSSVLAAASAPRPRQCQHRSPSRGIPSRPVLFPPVSSLLPRSQYRHCPLRRPSAWQHPGNDPFRMVALAFQPYRDHRLGRAVSHRLAHILGGFVASCLD